MRILSEIIPKGEQGQTSMGVTVGGDTITASSETTTTSIGEYEVILEEHVSKTKYLPDHHFRTMLEERACGEKPGRETTNVGRPYPFPRRPAAYSSKAQRGEKGISTEKLINILD